jgi:hypothetical protein
LDRWGVRPFLERDAACRLQREVLLTEPTVDRRVLNLLGAKGAALHTFAQAFPDYGVPRVERRELASDQRTIFASVSPVIPSELLSNRESVVGGMPMSAASDRVERRWCER